MALEGIPVPSGIAFPNAIRDVVQDPTVPDLINSTNALVESFLDANRTFANDAVETAMAVMNELRNAVLPPALPDPPPTPAIITSFSSTVQLGSATLPDLGAVSSDAGAFDLFAPDAVTIPNVTGEFPTYVPRYGSLNIPEAPALVLPVAPVAPALDTTFDIPTAPVANYGLPPALLEIALPSYSPPTLPLYNDTAPEFTLLPPSPVINWTEPVYSSGVADGVKAVLLTMLAGGTGLVPEVELGLWERGRSRENMAGRAKVSALIEEWAGRGFSYPQGYLDGAITLAREESERKHTDLSREIMFDQAKLEQTNRNFAVEKGITYEQVFTAIFLAVVDRNFQIAKFGVETAIQIYNMNITAFNVQQAVFAQKTERYKAQLEGVFAYIKAFEALANVERAKAEINTAKVKAYDSLIEAFKAQVEAYKALIQAQAAKADMQKNRVEVFKAQVDAQVATINGQRAVFEVYGERVRAEGSKAALEEANVRVYTAQIGAVATKQDVYFKQANATIETNKQKLDWNVANMTRLGNLHGAELNRIQANLAAYQQGIAVKVSQYDAERAHEQTDLQAKLELGRLSIAKFQVLLEEWKTRSTEIIQMAGINAESLRSAGQIASNLASGAMAGTHVSAGISAGASAGASHGVSTSNSTSQSKSSSESNGYQVNHNFAHRV